ncbi:hypothetical protein S14_207 [Shewanella sp. phage 1/4]|uniref:hypothetical protein n=1 Tax=Shewanella phage 1/4 TaxID=1458859 RepID=UPI0004F88D6E|nr:hypothetical protein S14_207 [Shewanella sp. phage 1/4]AHK11316.1 hypothetical protein S14_207 [Shewanella sp. phage 1/4]
MWLKQEDLHSVGIEGVNPTVVSICGISILLGCIGDCGGINSVHNLINKLVMIKDNDVIVTERSYDNLIKHPDYNLFTTYSNSDYYVGQNEKTIENLLSYFPELNILGDCDKYKFGIVCRVVEDDFRFHKNGGYRGKDEVQEHVYDSPQEQYFSFMVVMMENTEVENLYE